MAIINQIIQPEQLAEEPDYFVEAHDEYVSWKEIKSLGSINKNKWIELPNRTGRFYFKKVGYEIFDNQTGENIEEFDTLEEAALVLFELGFLSKHVSTLNGESEYTFSLADGILYLDRSLNTREMRRLNVLLTIN